MIQPPFLKKGDTIAIPAPGKKISPEVVKSAINIIESWGYQVKLGRNVFSTTHSYLSGSDAERLADLQSMLDDDSIRAILCARGGYGTTRIIDQLNFTSFLKRPKWICGFSDVTALHLKLQSLNVQSIHGTMPIVFLIKDAQSSVESLRNTLLGEFSVLRGGYHPSNLIGEVSGDLVGGNLSLLVDSLGTSSEIDTKNKILVIEEVDEYFYKIDRMLTQLKRAGKLSELSGLVVGYMSALKETELPFGESIYEIVMNSVNEYSFPVGFNFPIGHEDPNLAWIEGIVGKLKITHEESTLTF
jgi:muramoyltetrapeptide carboxypeptidase